MEGIFDSFEKLSMKIIFNIRATRDLKERLQYSILVLHYLFRAEQNSIVNWRLSRCLGLTKYYQNIMNHPVQNCLEA